MNHHYCDKCGQPVRRKTKRKPVKHTQQKRKSKRNYAPVVFLAGCAVLIVAAVFVMIGG